MYIFSISTGESIINWLSSMSALGVVFILLVVFSFCAHNLLLVLNAAVEDLKHVLWYFDFFQSLSKRCGATHW